MQCQFIDDAFRMHGCNGFLDKLHLALQQGHLQLGSYPGQVMTSIVKLSPWTAQISNHLPLQYAALQQKQIVFQTADIMCRIVVPSNRGMEGRSCTNQPNEPDEVNAVGCGTW
jgi:hypothetical protein